MNMIKHDQNLTMNSREIAELTGKRHDHVIRDIESIFSELELDAPKFGAVYQGGNGQDRKCYNLPKDLTLTLVSGYNIKLRHAIIKRLDELEEANQIHLPKTFSEALQLAAEQAKQLELAAPKVKFVEDLVERNTLMNATQIAQKFGKSAVWLNKQLEHFDVYNKTVKRCRAFNQWFVKNGFGEMKETEAGYSQALFSPAGEVWIHQKFVSEGIL